jgi:hypothetical protein
VAMISEAIAKESMMAVMLTTIPSGR